MFENILSLLGDLSLDDMQEDNLWNQQKKLLEHISSAGFSPEVVKYVKTWRIVAIGPHEYSYVLPRGEGKLRSMKAAQQKLRELQENSEKLQQGVSLLVQEYLRLRSCSGVKQILEGKEIELN